jgi:hypothetical protein
MGVGKGGESMRAAVAGARRDGERRRDYALAVPRSWTITMSVLVLCLVASMVIALIKLL